MLSRALRVAGFTVLLLSAAPASTEARSTGRMFGHERFTILMPPGWWVADVRPGPAARRFVPAKKPGAAAGASVVHFADARGNYFTVFVDHANDFEGDAVWTVRPGMDGASIELGAETPCERSRGPCSAGNGTLEIGTLPAVQLGGHRFSFLFGNVRAEQGVNLDTFRWLLQEFRAR